MASLQLGCLSLCTWPVRKTDENQTEIPSLNNLFCYDFIKKYDRSRFFLDFGRLYSNIPTAVDFFTVTA
jgi:hypothetical protein